MSPRPSSRTRQFLPFYVGWICLCAILFVLLRGAEDPSRRRGRILSTEAGTRALASLRARDPQRFAEYEVVHVAAARAGEGGAGGRWVVLVDRVPHTALRDAVVVELDEASGEVLLVRKPR